MHKEIAIHIIEEAARLHGRINATGTESTVYIVNPTKCPNHAQVQEAIRELHLHGGPHFEVKNRAGNYRVVIPKPAKPAHHGKKANPVWPLPRAKKQELARAKKKSKKK